MFDNMRQVLSKLIWKHKDPLMFADSNLCKNLTWPDGPSTTNWDEATLVTSQLRETEDQPDNHNLHWPVLDLDLPTILLPSSTNGHYHLVIKHAISWDEYVVLLETLSSMGIIEQGYANVSITRGYSAIRRPGVTKEMTPNRKDKKHHDRP